MSDAFDEQTLALQGDPGLTKPRTKNGESEPMGTRANGMSAARAKARARRIAVDAERVAREKQVEDAAAGFYLAAEHHAEIAGRLAASERGMGEHLMTMIAVGTDIDRAAALCDITAARARALVRAARTDPA